MIVISLKEIQMLLEESIDYAEHKQHRVIMIRSKQENLQYWEGYLDALKLIRHRMDDLNSQ